MRVLILSMLMAFSTPAIASGDVATITVDPGFNEVRVKSPVVGEFSVRLDRFNSRSTMEVDGRTLRLKNSYKVEGLPLKKAYEYREELIGNRVRTGYITHELSAIQLDLFANQNWMDEHKGRGTVNGVMVDFWVDEEHYHGPVFWVRGDAELTSFGTRTFFRVTGSYKNKEALTAALLGLAFRLL